MISVGVTGEAGVEAAPSGMVILFLVLDVAQ
jgi:hypothetical protein